MRGLAIGITLALILLLVPGGHFLLVLVIPLAFFALLMFRTTWQPVPRTYRPAARRPGPAERR
jgi:4-hydroxybenzoate polyprenyltransferase